MDANENSAPNESTTYANKTQLNTEEGGDDIDIDVKRMRLDAEPTTADIISRVQNLRDVVCWVPSLGKRPASRDWQGRPVLELESYSNEIVTEALCMSLGKSAFVFPSGDVWNLEPWSAHTPFRFLCGEDDVSYVPNLIIHVRIQASTLCAPLMVNLRYHTLCYSVKCDDHVEVNKFMAKIDEWTTYLGIKTKLKVTD